MTKALPSLVVTHTVPHGLDAAWAVLRDIRAWYWPDRFHSLPREWFNRVEDHGVTVNGAGTWTHAYLPIFPWFAEPVGFTLSVDDVGHAMTIAEVPANPRSSKRAHTQKWSVAAVGTNTCVMVELWHAPTSFIQWYAHPLLARSAKAKLLRIEQLTGPRQETE